MKCRHTGEVNVTTWEDSGALTGADTRVGLTPTSYRLFYCCCQCKIRHNLIIEATDFRKCQLFFSDIVQHSQYQLILIFGQCIGACQIKHMKTNVQYVALLKAGDTIFDYYCEIVIWGGRIRIENAALTCFLYRSFQSHNLKLCFKAAIINMKFACSCNSCPRETVHSSSWTNHIHGVYSSPVSSFLWQHCSMWRIIVQLGARAYTSTQAPASCICSAGSKGTYILFTWLLY